MEAQQPPNSTGVVPVAFAIGVVVGPVGLIVKPSVIAPLGAATTLDSVGGVDGTGARARIHAFAHLGEGEPASGPESLLYSVDPIS
jgi:hypothetical protein